MDTESGNLGVAPLFKESDTRNSLAKAVICTGNLDGYLIYSQANIIQVHYRVHYSTLLQIKYHLSHMCLLQDYPLHQSTVSLILPIFWNILEGFVIF